ncbi:MULTISPECIES: hypothetical protein [Bradyrhizobium]|jgi:hypothetical protein|uniref:Uncharacterized protein n=1 Tax=Bradyrhizobium barranii subsp. barranii TaxID=2823807 RepID=A0A939M4U1_9BRAD|nr:MULTISPECIES: hypothetical protein [Bradyrhizobium]UEM15869.1 hypothetical protein J4G43_017625 [Bradyrhizobium barranii subsp. barranii]
MVSDIFSPPGSLAVDRARSAPERLVRLLQGLFPSEPEIGKEMGIVGNRAKIVALIYPLDAGKPSADQRLP